MGDLNRMCLFQNWLNEVEPGRKSSRKEDILTAFLDGDYDDWGSLMSLIEKAFIAGKAAGIDEAWNDEINS